MYYNQKPELFQKKWIRVSFVINYCCLYYIKKIGFYPYFLS
jgi:hypothetical protein